MAKEVKAADTLVSAKGGTLDIVRDGEVVAQLAVPPGAHKASGYLAFLPPDCEVQVGDGLAVFAARGGFARQKYGPGSHETAANPDFEPTSASRLQAQLEHGLKRLASVENRVEAKLKALKAVDVIPTAPVGAPAPAPTSAPAPTPAPVPPVVE